MMTLNLLSPMRDTETQNVIFFDVMENKSFKLKLNDKNEFNLVEISNEKSEVFMKQEQEKNEKMCELPLDHLAEIMQQEKILTEKNKANLSARKI